LSVVVIASPIGGWGASFTVPVDIALRIRLDDALTDEHLAQRITQQTNF
jgi:hypothetical protein